MTHARVAVVGSFNVDHVWRAARLPRPGETLAGEYATGPGGKGFNQAVAARRAGAATSFICALGDDPGGALARSLAARDGIDLHALQSDAPTGTAGIYLDEAGNNTIMIGAGANADLDAGFIDAQADTIHAAAVVLTQLESPTDSVLRALRLGNDRGAVTLLNPAPANAACPPELLAVADVLTPNETEFATLLEAHAGPRVDPTAVGDLDDAALHRLCRQLLPVGTVVVTLGATGAFVSHPADQHRGDTDASYRIKAARVRAIDTTGAGDAFNGALAAGLATAPGAAFAGHVRYASQVAALATEREGAAVSMPWRTAVLERFSERQARLPDTR